MIVDVDAKRLAWMGGLAVVVVLAIVLLLQRDDGDDDGGSASTSTSETTSTTSAATSTTTAPPPTTTTTGSTGTTATTAPSTSLPAPDVSAMPGGGSGEVALDWEAVPGATGYEVQRAAAASGPFVVVVEVDVVDGDLTALADVVNLYTDAHTYIPDSGGLTAPDASPTFHLVDVGTGERCYQVRAVDASGPGAWSPTACGSPP